VPTYTAQQLINISLTNLGILDQGGTPSVSDSNAALDRLNLLIGQWRIQDLYIWSVGSATYPLVLAQKGYTIGPSAADFNAPRPNYIEQALISIPGPNPNNALTHPMKFISQQEYGAIVDQNATSNIPERLYNDRGSPISTLYIWPTARCASPTNLVLYTWAQLSSYATLADSADLPEGYDEAITNALAVRLDPMFGMAVASDIVQVTNALALAAEEKIKVLNARARGLMMPVPQVAPDVSAKGGQ
jgi:hypothetical protein